MIRSLVTSSDAVLDENYTPRRNLTRESLEASFLNGDCMWLDFVDAETEEIQWLESLLQLHPAVVADLMREDRRPTLMVYPKYLFISLFQPAIRLNKVDGKEIHCLIHGSLFVTVRGSDATSVDEAYNRVTQNPDSWKRGVAYFLYLTTQYVVDLYYPLLDRISNQLNQLEENLLSGKVNNKDRKPVYTVKQQLINLRQMIAPQREVLSSVIGESRLASDSETRDLFRHLYERLLRVYDVIDAQRDLSSNVLDLMQSQESGRMVEAVNRLTIFSMIFLPLTFFTGLFELNFATTSNPLVLPINGTFMFLFVIMCMVVSAAFMTITFRRRGWL
jgi:magnesium transporter